MAGRVLALALVLTIAVGCTGRGSGTVTSPRDTSPAPSPEQLQLMLDAEFERLGIDPSKVMAAAPTGSTNGVFDLVADVIDPDGDGPQDPTGVQLSWTERLIGDYDQNGMVTQGDLTPIGQFWNQTINYDDPSLHDGVAYWPSGDPEGGEAANWRLAQVDGNDNGLIEGADITSIAQHWLERISGYRVYRKAPGESTFTWIENPADSSSKFTIERPAAAAGGPVRVSFTDTPAVSGEYEYYVIGFATETSSSSMEGQTPSNTVSAALAFTGIDVHPPEWDTTVGVTNATANGDGTVTVEWGTASDIAHPPAVASPPVSYTLYYSTESPINFETAYAVEDAVSPWTSAQLVDGLEYYFAIRASDSADPPNVDENTEERSATITGGGVDEDSPVWTAVTNLPHSETKYPIEGGVAAIDNRDGLLRIHCAPAVDVLSPPVHYDLYCLSLSGLDDFSAQPLTWNSETQQLDIHENAILIEDISPVYDLEWENRHPLTVMVVAYDSAVERNEHAPAYCGRCAPTDIAEIPIDPDFPWVLEGSTSLNSSNSVLDRSTNTLLALISPSRAPGADSKRIYLLKQNILEGTWEAQMVYEHFLPESIHIMDMILNDDREIFAQVRFIKGIGDGYDQFWRMDLDGSFTLWGPGLSMPEWIESQVGHNGLPATTSFKDSAVDPGFHSAYYTWYDEEAEEWVDEFVCDPGRFLELKTRPDGVLQAITKAAWIKVGADPPNEGFVYERSVDGVWTQVLSLGAVPTFYTTPFVTNNMSMGESPIDWSLPSAWNAFVSTEDSVKLFTYSIEDGYSELFLPQAMGNMLPIQDENGSVSWHLGQLARIEKDGSYNDYIIGPYHYCYHYERMTTGTGECLTVDYLDPWSGQAVWWKDHYVVETGKHGYFLRSTYPHGANIYDPLGPSWQ